MSPDPELLGDEPVRLGRRPGRTEPDDEILEFEPLPAWRPPRWLVVAVLLVAVVGTAGWYVDRQERARETRALDACRGDLRTAVAISDLRLMAMADYLDPALSLTRGARHGHIADLMADDRGQAQRIHQAGSAGAARRRACRPGLPCGVGPAVALRSSLATAGDHGVLLRLRRAHPHGRRPGPSLLPRLG